MDDLEKMLVPESQDDDGQTTEAPTDNEPPDEDFVPEATTATATATEDTSDDGQGQPETGSEDGEVVPKKQYDSLRTDYTRKAMELAELKRSSSVKAADVTETLLTTPTKQGIQGFIQAEIARGLSEAMAPLAEQQRTLEIQTTVVGLSEKYSEDFEKVSPAFIQALEENPQVLELENGLELLFKATRSDYLEKTAQATAIAKQQAKQASTQQKVLVTDKSAGVAGNQPAVVSDEDAVRESITSIARGGSIFNY